MGIDRGVIKRICDEVEYYKQYNSSSDTEEIYHKFIEPEDIEELDNLSTLNAQRYIFEYIEQHELPEINNILNSFTVNLYDGDGEDSCYNYIDDYGRKITIRGRSNVVDFLKKEENEPYYLAF